MEREDFAVLISAVSLLIAGTALGWNIFRDVVLKPRLKVTLDCGFLASEALTKPVQQIIISGTNFGPGRVKVSIVRWKRASLLHRLRGTAIWGFQAHDYKNPVSGQLPKMLDVGERVDLLFPFVKDSIFAERPTHIGLRDYFGRDSWVPRKMLRKAQAEYDKRFVA